MSRRTKTFVVDLELRKKNLTVVNANEITKNNDDSISKQESNAGINNCLNTSSRGMETYIYNSFIILF